MSHVNKQGVVVKSFKEIDGTSCAAALGNAFIIYPVTHNLVDLFWGEGYTNQARFKWQKSRGGDRSAKTVEPLRGEWVLWSKTSPLPKGFISILEEYKLNVV